MIGAGGADALSTCWDPNVGGDLACVSNFTDFLGGAGFCALAGNEVSHSRLFSGPAPSEITIRCPDSVILSRLALLLLLSV